MKKTLCFMLVSLSFAGSAFAFTDLATNGVTTPAAAVRGGADQPTAQAAPTPLIQFSTGVSGLVNFTSDATAKTSPGYLIAARHATGSKNFATANSKPNVYWKQATKIAGTVTVTSAMQADIATSADPDVTFAAGQGWTSY